MRYPPWYSPRLSRMVVALSGRCPAVARRFARQLEVAMKSRTDYLVMNLPARRGFVNITRDVERVVRESGVQEGLALVNAMHITASVFINDDEGGLHHDYEQWLERLPPHAPAPPDRPHEPRGDKAHGPPQ